ncbi:MAG: phosphoadenylyl-sulfate reductase [Methanobacteriota archaeon]
MEYLPAVSDDDLSKFEDRTAEEVLRWATGRFGERVALASSFGAEDCVIVDILARLGTPRVFTLDTGRLPQETYDVMDAVRERYGIRVEVVVPETTAVESIVREHGLNLFYRSVELRKLCCRVRKVEPLERALKDLDAWIAGLRRDQEPSRRRIAKVERDATHGGIVKVNPLADWTWGDVMAYVRVHDVPYNRLHDLGYPSIGCAPCTRAVAPGDDLRAGRWWWERDAGKECGLHADPLAGPAAPAARGGT